MHEGRKSLHRFLIEEQRRLGGTGELTALLTDLARAIKAIGVGVARRALEGPSAGAQSVESLASRVAIATCEWGGQLAAVASRDRLEAYPVPARYPRGKYLLVLDPLVGAPSLEVAGAAGTIFSILRRARAEDDVEGVEFLQRGDRQVSAGYAIYGPATQLVLTLGHGVFGFTLDEELGELILTHPDLRLPDDGRELAIDASDQRGWEPPVERYVSECLAGSSGPRQVDFGWRWMASLVPDVHRLLLRGGVVMDPRNTERAAAPAHCQLVYQANPMALLVEQAGGAASTGRERILDLVPDALDQRVPLLLGSRAEVDRLVRYHREHDGGVEPFRDPLFGTRSLFRLS